MFKRGLLRSIGGWNWNNLTFSKIQIDVICSKLHIDQICSKSIKYVRNRSNMFEIDQICSKLDIDQICSIFHIDQTCWRLHIDQYVLTKNKTFCKLYLRDGLSWLLGYWGSCFFKIYFNASLVLPNKYFSNNLHLLINWVNALNMFSLNKGSVFK
jgi:hypothetical protein